MLAQKHNITLKRTFRIAFLLIILASCKQPSTNNKVVVSNDSSSVKISHLKKDTSSFTNIEEYEPGNESIDTLPTGLKEFIPNGYALINFSEGDANLDNFKDAMLVVGKTTEETTSNNADGKPTKRLLLLLLGQPNKTYKLFYRNDNAIYCINCGGAFGDPFTGASIKNGYFSIEHGIAGGQHWEQVTTFKFDKEKANWFLYKDHFISYKLNNSKDENAKALVKETDKLETIKNFGIISFEKFNIYNKKGH